MTVNHSRNYREIRACRICGNEDIVSVLDLGVQVLTGVFPKTVDAKITQGPLELVKCREDGSGNQCGLLQLRHSYHNEEMYGLNYGYRSGLNPSMVKHLQSKVNRILGLVKPDAADIVLDIGSNDGTLLSAYPADGMTLVGIDPTGEKFKQYYPPHVRLITDFFSAKTFREHWGGRRAKVVTSIAMFYDLEEPLDFMRQIHEILADDGIWVFEQSYMPTMLKQNSFDTVCHEHLEYYHLKPIKWMTDRAGFKIVDIDLNPANGGSFEITVAKKGNAALQEASGKIEGILAAEARAGLNTLQPYLDFRHRINDCCEQLVGFISAVNADGKKLVGYGASTKGNVILQYCRLTADQIPCIAEVNRDKFGCFTPGTLIPIVSEADAKALKPDYMLVLPWHFKEGIIERERDYLAAGGKLVMPLPTLEIITHPPRT